MAAAKGHRIPNAPKGRKVGSQNKLTAELKDMILGALSDSGGQAYLAARAKDNPAAFLTLIGKVLPLQVNADNTHSGSLEITWRKPGES